MVLGSTPEGVGWEEGKELDQKEKERLARHETSRTTTIPRGFPVLCRDTIADHQKSRIIPKAILV